MIKNTPKQNMLILISSLVVIAVIIGLIVMSVLKVLDGKGDNDGSDKTQTSDNISVSDKDKTSGPDETTGAPDTNDTDSGVETTATPTESDTEDTSVPDDTTTQPDDTTTEPIDTTTKPIDTSVNEPDTTEPDNTTTPPAGEDDPIGRPTVSIYPVGLSERVGDDYFNDVVFVGDSRTQGIQLYGGLSATFYAYQGLNVSTARTNPFIAEGGQNLTIANALKRHPEYKKIYICLGVNEYWMAENTYKSNYEALIDSIMESSPNAAIYICSVFPLADGLPNSGAGLNNAKMNSFNAISLEIAQSRGLYYVDVAEAFTKPDGRRVLDGTESPDGVHLNTAGVTKLIEYLRTHTK